MRPRVAARLCGLLALALIAVPVRAAEWSSELALYLFATGLSGDAGVGDIRIVVDQSFSDIVDSLEFGGMAGFSTTNGRWTVLADAVIANIGVDGRSQGGVVRGDLEVDTTILEADLGYQLSNSVTLFAGARWVDLSSSVELRIASLRLKDKGSESWFDPVVGLRWRSSGDGRWQYALRGDVGGFGVGSDFTWNAVATVSYRVSKRTRLGAGYRVLDFDYDSGSGAKRFVYDMRMEGPVVGVGFSF